MQPRHAVKCGVTGGADGQMGGLRNGREARRAFPAPFRGGRPVGVAGFERFFQDY